MKKDNRYAAGIITFNPQIKRLRKNIESISMQVEFIYIYDNASENIDDILKMISSFNNCRIIRSKNNNGIAKALNCISKIAIDDGIDWMLTLDHDSIAPSNIIERYSLYVSFDKVGIICPIIYDKRRPSSLNNINEEYSEVDICITSGSLVNLKVWKEIKGYDDWLFIGLVDDEYCLRNRINGYKIIQVNNVVLDHELGNIKQSKISYFYRELTKKTGIEFFNKLSYKREVSALRLYFATRNMIYMNYKYKDCKGTVYIKRNYLYNGISSIIRGTHKVYLIVSFIKGVKDGKFYVNSLQGDK